MPQSSVFNKTSEFRVHSKVLKLSNVGAKLSKYWRDVIDLGRFCSGISYSFKFSTTSNSHVARENVPDFMAFGSRQLLPRLHDLSVSLLGRDIFPTQTAKDLGVTLDPYLTYDEHIINTVSTRIW